MPYKSQVIALNDLLTKAGVDPATVLVMRHRPNERELKKVLPWLAAEHPDTYNAYQQTQGPKAEKAMQRARYVASFIGHQPGKAVFVGLYRRGEWHELSYTAYLRKPVCQALRDHGGDFQENGRNAILWFDLALTGIANEFKGRLVVNWPGLERSWYRWAERNCMPISCIHEESILTDDKRDWDELSFKFNELRILPSRWQTALSQWRGIYFILDETDGKGYVGAAYGSDNILGRWRSYAVHGHGGNKELRGRDPSRFRFSILQIVSPDLDRDKVLDLERRWKVRLHTCKFGLNKN